MFFDDFLQPRKLNGFLDEMELGMLPDLPGLYRTDYCEHTGHPAEDETLVDAVLLSHAHVDHVGMVRFLRQEIPVYMSPRSRCVLDAMEETGTSSEYITFKHGFSFGEKKNGEPKKLIGKDIADVRDVRTGKEKFTINGFDVQAFGVDHSLPGARAYIVDTPSETVAYTGDLRMHGYHGDYTREFARAAGKHGVDVLLCEGTRVAEVSSRSEDDVFEDVSALVQETDGLVVANFPPRDTDRLRTFWRAAKRHGRRLAVNLKQAYLLDHLPPGDELPRSDDENIALYLPRKGWGLWSREDVPAGLREQEYDIWEREFLDRSNLVTAERIREKPSDFIWRCDFFELKELIDVRPPDGSIYIRSVVEPFDEEMAFDAKRVKNWLENFNLLPVRQTHASGHASGKDLKWLIDTIRPKKIVPVHTEHPQAFRRLHDNVVVPETGKPIRL